MAVPFPELHHTSVGRSAQEEKISAVGLGIVRRLDPLVLLYLVAAHQKVQNKGGELKLLNLPSNILNVLGVTQLITVFDIFEDEDEAVASFS